MFNSSSPFRACSCVPETSSRTTPQPAAALKPLKLPLLGQKVLLEAWCFDSKLWFSVLQTRYTTPLLIRILRPEQMRYLPRAEGGATDQRHEQRLSILRRRGNKQVAGRYWARLAVITARSSH